ncbi:ankyrin repeat domain-containing protein [Fadolivirus algeromassiliense]|jgi:ankyrin repeat protein|uniref:Ankyrin repeat domain-containing protein n=1 Tax=Fadolivirus FV1/VV64 TaxID=3070911 RepID=A0A7D3QUG1_9VIRU|nr:ankyrin repeat domain-containing protein [Fadolivirus algeromassiliense]QKF93504.1 ankyrin repeat domain-containing protein [Fadolivirus FV1/VV64]
MNYTQQYYDIIKNNDLSSKLKLYNQSIKDDLELRKLYVSNRNDQKVSQNDAGLFSVYNNYDIFKVLPLSDEEKAQSVIMTRDMEKMQVGSSAISTHDEFLSNFDIFTEGVLECMDWSNLFLAGGSVLAMISKLPENVKTDEQKRHYYHKIKYNKSDLDLYIYGLDEYAANKKMYQVYENIKKVLPCDCICVRSSRAISIVSQYPYRHIQIVLRLFKSPAEVLHSFDVDSCSVGFDGRNVWCTRRAHYAITNKRNIIDMSRRSLAYEYRLKKYNERGYGVVVPNFDPSKVNYRIFSKSPAQVTGLARLLILENIDDSAKHNLYRDVLNMHQITMYKNLTLNSKYEASDYSLVFLPWGEGWNCTKIKAHLNKKNSILNETYNKYKATYTYVDEDEEYNNVRKEVEDFAFVDDDDEEEKPIKKVSNIKKKSNVNIHENDDLDDNQELVKPEYKGLDKLPQYVCFVGTIYQVVKDNGIKKPQFHNPLQEKFYINKFVCDRLKWFTTFDAETTVLGSFTTISETNADEWYNDAYGSIGTDVLCEYICNHNITEVHKLLEATKNNGIEGSLDVLVNSRDVTNRNPLHLAITLNQLDTCQLLLEYGANPMNTSKLYKNALHTAYACGNLDIIKLLLQVGPTYPDFNTNKQDSYGLTPIMYTIMYGHTECFKYLYENTVKIDTTLIWIFKLDKSKSYRALEMCLLYKRYDIARYLLDKGYDIHDYYLQDSKVLKNKRKSKNHIMQQAILNWDITFIGLLLERNGYDTYKKYMNHESALINKIKKTKKENQLKYIIDMVCYLCELNKSENLLVDLLIHFASRNCMNHLEYLLDTKKVSINCSTSNTTVLDYVLNNINKLYINKIKLELENKESILYANMQNELTKETYAVSNNREAALMSTGDSNSWLIKDIPDIESEEKSLDKVIKTLDKLETLKNYLVTRGARTYNDINNITITSETKFETTLTTKFTRPVVVVEFRDLDKKVMYRTDKYIKLFTAIKENDLETIKNLTINTSRDNAIHLCVYDQNNYDPLYLALEYNTDLLSELINIMDMQKIKKKEKKNKKKVFINKKKLYMNNKKLGKNQIEEAEESDEEIVLYEEEQLDESNLNAITNYGLDDMLNRTDLLNTFLIKDSSYQKLEVLLKLNHKLINNRLYNNIVTYLRKLCKAPIRNEDILSLQLIIKHYSTLLNNSKEYKYNLPNTLLYELIIASNSVELLKFFANDCKQFWVCETIHYPFEHMHDILFEFARKSISQEDNYEQLLNEIMSIDNNCYKVKIDNQLPIMVSLNADNFLALFNAYYKNNENEVYKLLTERYNDGTTVMHRITSFYKSHVLTTVMSEIKDTTQYRQLLNVQTKDKLQTPLMLAIKSLDIQMANNLIILGADQNITDIFGNTALHYAMYYNLYPVIKELTIHSKENHFRMTPQDYILNKMRSSVHHARNDKISKAIKPIELYYIIGIYNDFILGKQLPREFTSDDNIKQVNDYIMSKIKGISNGEIPESLKL